MITTTKTPMGLLYRLTITSGEQPVTEILTAPMLEQRYAWGMEIILQGTRFQDFTYRTEDETIELVALPTTLTLLEG